MRPSDHRAGPPRGAVEAGRIRPSVFGSPLEHILGIKHLLTPKASMLGLNLTA